MNILERLAAEGWSIAREELKIRKRYEILSITNDILIAIWFIIGSILFFNDSTTELGTWLFLIGSIELLIRPVIRLIRYFHLQRFHDRPPVSSEESQDF